MAYIDEYNKWLESDAVDEASKKELRAIAGEAEELEDRFTEMMEFGTAGLRGIMRAGLNGMNVYTVRYATQGLADLINGCGEDKGGGVAISFDSRHHSEEFAREAACVLAANGIHVFLFDELRPTPELSFTIRETHSISGINITASHNTKEYNGYKAYWSDGAQLAPEHAAKVSASMERNDIFDDVKIMDLEKAKGQGLITMIGAEIDEKYMSRVLEQSVGRRYVEQAADDFTVVYTPFHGTGYKLVPEVLRRLGMKHILPVPEQMVLDGDFPTVESPNPENTEGFAMAIELAKKNDVDLIIGTDPDGDRCGLVIRKGDEYEALSGNQIGVLLLDYLITVRREQGTLPENGAAIKSIVSTMMANRICDVNHVFLAETLTGFKFIGEKIKEFEETGRYEFVFGFEESNGFLAGTYARDKDAIVASMLIAEMGCYYRTRGMSMHDAINDLYNRYGHYKDGVKSFVFKGFGAQEKMASLMAELRGEPLKSFGFPVVRVRDYKTGIIKNLRTGEETSTGMTESNVLFYELEGGGCAVVRPSGTEPKIKFYVSVKGDDEADAESKFKKIQDAGVEILQKA